MPTPKTQKLGRFLVEECEGQASSFNNPTPESAPVVIVYFKSRWGEVDGYLPVLHKFKERHPGWRMIAVIGSERMSNTIEEQKLFYNELLNTVDTLIRLAPKSSQADSCIFYRKWIRKITSWYHQKCVRLSWRPIFNYLKNNKIKLIIKDHGHDDSFLLQLQSLYPAKCVSAPHGTGIYLEQSEASFRKKKNAKIDLFLAGDEVEVPSFEKTLPKNTSIEVVGRPRYDRWWIEHLAQLPCFQSSEEYELAQQSQRVFLFATRGPSSSYFPTSVFEYLVKTVAETVLNQPGHLLLIKPHPQQDLEPIKSIMAQYNPNKWKISSLQTMQLAHISDFVICMVSGVILDALAMGKPTVEYFQYVKEQHLFLKDKNGNPVSAYTHLGLAVPAGCKEELEELIDDYFSQNSNSDKWERQRKQALKFMKMDNYASHRAIECIDKVIGQP